MAKKKAKKFSAVKAVKANARERIGQPKPERIMEEKPHGESRRAKHKPKLTDLLTEE